VIGINGTWPPPEIHCNLGDTIMVRLTNSLGNQSTALHFHGENQGKSSQMEVSGAVVYYSDLECSLMEDLGRCWRVPMCPTTRNG
jgi:FtsP/CotA-like multicopper oxidase with cupredoxin domain